MTFELRQVAERIHFTLPESVWAAKQPFFQSFGFSDPVQSARQYRLFDNELTCSAPFGDVWRHTLDKLPKLSELFSIGSYSMNNRLLMSVKPQFAERIVSGQKRIEL